MSPKITSDHLARAAIVYVRQSTMARGVANLESQRQQYDLASAAGAAGFASVKVIDDDLGRSGSGSVERPGFRRLVAMVCSGDVARAKSSSGCASLIETCKLSGVDPHAYLADTLTRIVDGHLDSKIDDLLPWAYAKASPFKHAA
jgi:hypothetical protein